MKILVTGAAGFIGCHVALYLLSRGDQVVGLDNVNDYYDVNLKLDRLKLIENQKQAANFQFVKMDLADKDGIAKLFAEEQFDKVVHLAAQAGVRYSLENPHAYIDSNIVGFMNILEGCRHQQVKHLVYASSSSVYGANEEMPFSVHHNVDHPLSLYAATKKSNELMAHTYSSLYGLPTTGLRFFTVYGPWGRPDMALFLFTKNILAGKPIDVFNYGKHRRDFTYVDDIVEGVVRTLDKTATVNPDWTGMSPDPGTSKAPWRVYNIGNNQPVELLTYISTLEDKLGKKAEMNLLPLQPGDVPDTYANVEDLVNDVDYKPSTTVAEGIDRFVQWYRDYYQV
ncbi:NAD-dependent epimerase [Spartinivicinus poritis]|uniref:NAD-dependent epimerase n=1 Tax=Spartinivicinus poritis TaxID=2994640 RepID=A0ABT5U9D0_9GAMM|nr:NAD-dependent epimerase [Spartinivicinus sp. A2-2]MDE1462978.1 NAD-dependent epimerase [Spartinivicinus sp. A2-2]